MHSKKVQSGFSHLLSMSVLWSRVISRSHLLRVSHLSSSGMRGTDMWSLASGLSASTVSQASSPSITQEEEEEEEGC